MCREGGSSYILRSFLRRVTPRSLVYYWISLQSVSLDVTDKVFVGEQFMTKAETAPGPCPVAQNQVTRPLGAASSPNPDAFPGSFIGSPKPDKNPDFPRSPSRTHRRVFHGEGHVTGLHNAIK